MNALALRIVDLVSDDTNKKYEPVGRMAAAIIELRRTQNECLPQDLSAKDFTPDEVSAHWHMAKSIADIEMKFMNEAPSKLSFLKRIK